MLKKAGISRRERRQAVEGRAAHGFMEDLRAAIEESERKKGGRAANATTGPNPGETPGEHAGEQGHAAEGKLRPGREMGPSAGTAGGGPADATARATGDGLSHERVAQVKSQWA